MNDYSWLVERFVDRTHGVAHAAVVSADGLLLTASANLPDDRADQLAAIAAGVASLTEGAARCLELGPVRQTVIEMELGYVMLTVISDGSSMVVLVEPDSNLGDVGYEMTLLVERVGDTLTPGTRLAQSPSLRAEHGTSRSVIT